MICIWWLLIISQVMKEKNKTNKTFAALSAQRYFKSPVGLTRVSDPNAVETPIPQIKLRPETCLNIAPPAVTPSRWSPASYSTRIYWRWRMWRGLYFGTVSSDFFISRYPCWASCANTSVVNIIYPFHHTWPHTLINLQTNIKCVLYKFKCMFSHLPCRIYYGDACMQ